MKLKLISSTLIIFFIALLIPVKAQSAFTTGYPKTTLVTAEGSVAVAKVIELKGKIDTAKSAGAEITSLTTGEINVGLFTPGYMDKADSINVPWLECTLSGSTISTRKITTEIWGAWKPGGTYKLIQTIMTADSAATLLRKKVNFSGYPYPVIKVVTKKATGNTVCNFDMAIIFRRKL